MTAPMQRAVNAAAEALRAHRETPGAWDMCAACDENDARLVITAAYPHLFQNLTKENRALRAEIARLTELLSPTA